MRTFTVCFKDATSREIRASGFKVDFGNLVFLRTNGSHPDYFTAYAAGTWTSVNETGK